MSFYSFTSTTTTTNYHTTTTTPTATTCYLLYCSLFLGLFFAELSVPTVVCWHFVCFPLFVCDYFIKIFQGRQQWVRRISGQYSYLQAALLALVIYTTRIGGSFLNGRVIHRMSCFFSTIMVGVGIFTLDLTSYSIVSIFKIYYCCSFHYI